MHGNSGPVPAWLRASSAVLTAFALAALPPVPAAAHTTPPDSTTGDTAAQQSPAPGCTEATPPAPFTDRDDIRPVHRLNVDCAFAAGIAGGFPDGSYRPAAPVRRDQMAAFIARTLRAAAVGLPDPAERAFTDIDGNTHADDIDRLAAAGVVVGTSPTTFGPAQLVRRDQIASFILRAVAYVEGAHVSELASGADRFDDVGAGNVHRENINGAAALGLAHGRTVRTYDPAAPTRRDQMGSFLVRTLSFLQGEDLAGLSLRGDGLGAGMLIGTPMAAVVERLTGELGAPSYTSGWEVYCELAGPGQARTFTWADSLTVTFLDPGDPRLEAYSYGAAADDADPLGLTTPVGIGLDSTSSDVGAAYGERASFRASETNPFGSFWSVEPVEGGRQVIFVEDDRASASVELIGANLLFCD